MGKTEILVLIFVIFTIEVTKCAEKELENMFVDRCDEKLAKDKSEKYDKCDAEASDEIKEAVKSCAKDICNKDGKFNKLDVCCYAVKPNAMFECFEKTIIEIETKDAKEKGAKREDYQKTNTHTAAKIVECYDEVDDD